MEETEQTRLSQSPERSSLVEAEDENKENSSPSVEARQQAIFDKLNLRVAPAGATAAQQQSLMQPAKLWTEDVVVNARDKAPAKEPEEEDTQRAATD